MRRDRLPLALLAGSPFRRLGDALRLLGADDAERTKRLAAFARDLEARGEITLRGESFGIGAPFAPDLPIAIDRGAVPWLGVRAYGVHLCCWSRAPNGPRAWVAVRARSKNFGGLWDNTVAGGQPLGLGLLDNLVKECAEEALIPEALARRAAPMGEIRYLRADPTGLKPDTLFCYSLEVPADFVPRPNDGEVERFLHVPFDELAAAIAAGPVCKPNCALVWLRFLLRHGHLEGDLDAAARAALERDLEKDLP